MYVNKVITQTNNIYRNNNSTNPIQKNISFEAVKVDKGMLRFYEFNSHRMPKTLIDHLATLSDISILTPIQAQQDAFKKLKDAHTVEEVKKELFPNETLFQDIKSSIETNATIGILGIIREFQEIFPNGILKNEEDLSLYLLKKIFLEAKTLDEINEDLNEDLIPDIKAEFKRRYPESGYIHSSTFRSLGIHLPDTNYLNSLKFTREGYSEEFGLKVSKGQLEYWNSLSDEEKFEILSRRCEGRDNWWNSLTHEQRLELAIGIDSDEELYKNYRRYVNASKRKLREGTENPEETLPNRQLTRKIAVGSAKLKDKDIFVLWFKKNLSNFYDSLSESDKDIIHLRRMNKLCNRWKEMTPEERTELINKMRVGREPLQYTMIDAWNHSADIIKALSSFLKSKQILKPIDLLYETEEFSEFQSKIMTEFWQTYPEFAEQLGENIRAAQEKIEESINNGTFEGLKERIKQNRQYRKKMFEEEEAKERFKQKVEAEEHLKAQLASADYKADFASSYKKHQVEMQKLPPNYVDDIIGIMLEMYPEDVIRAYTEAIKESKRINDNILEKMDSIDISKHPKYDRYTHALEAAISCELSAKGAGDEIFAVPMPYLHSEMKNRCKYEIDNKVKENSRINHERIAKLYNEFKKDLTQSEISDILFHYFIGLGEKDKTHQQLKYLGDYIASYGRSALILFSPQSAYSAGQKEAFNHKFIANLPKEIAEKDLYLLRGKNKIEKEDYYSKILKQYEKRMNFLPKEFLTRHLKSWAMVFRWVENIDQKTADELNMNDNLIMYKPETFERYMAKTENVLYRAFLIPPPRMIMHYPAKMELLAMEAALADELYRVSGDEKVYGYLFENLANFFEQALLEKPGKIKQGVDLTSWDNSSQISLHINEKPNIHYLRQNYRDYISVMNEEQMTHSLEYEIPKKDLIEILNPDASLPERDKLIEAKLALFYGIE